MTPQDRNALVPTLTDEQWSMVLNMFKSFNGKSSTEKLTGKSFSQWILHTSASYLMIGNKSLLMDLCDIFPSPIVLPDGTHTNVVQE